MYSKEGAKSIIKNDNKFISVGIQENVILKGAREDVSPNGNRFIEITFEKDGATLVHTEWEPTKNQYLDTDEKLQEKMNNQYSRMLQILNCFYKDEDLNFNGETFKEFAKYIVEMLNNANKGYSEPLKLRVKLVYNNKGYICLPNYAKFTFIEPMVLPEGESSKITKLPFDQFVKPIEADKETTVTNPLMDNSVSMTTPPIQGETTKTDDLPF